MMFHPFLLILYHLAHTKKHVLFKALAIAGSQKAKGKKRSYCSFGVTLIYNFNIIKDNIKQFV